MIPAGLCLFFACTAALLYSGGAEAAGHHDIQRQIATVAPEKSLVLLQDPEGMERYRHGDLTRFIPASTLKIMTALVALKMLGEDYRFATRLYLDEHKNLVIQGSGDPLLISEEITAMAHQLLTLGYTHFQSLVLDDSAIAWQGAPGTGVSDNPYDAANGGLIVNFNTVYVEKTGAGVIRSAEVQTPLTQIARDLVQKKPAGRYRMNIGASRQLSLSYSGQIIRQLFMQTGVVFSQDTLVTPGKNKVEKHLLFTYQNSRDLINLVRLMFQFSNNFIANQIGLALADDRPASIDDAVMRVADWLEADMRLNREDVYFEEFSGISRHNRISVHAMMTLLRLFQEYAYLLESKGNALVKSGTLDGIYNYAGYLQIKQQLWPIVIVTYSKNNRRDQLLQLMQQLGQYIAG